MFLFSDCNNHFPVLNLQLTRTTIIMENRIFKRGKNSKNYSEIRIDPKTENSTDDNIPVVICGISLQVSLLIGQLTIVNVIDSVMNLNQWETRKKSLGRTGQFLVTASGILFFFIVYGYLQGRALRTKLPDSFDETYRWIVSGTLIKKNYFHMVILNRLDGILRCYNSFIIQYVPLWNLNSNKIQAPVQNILSLMILLMLNGHFQ